MPSSVHSSSSSHWKRVLLPADISPSTVVSAVPSSNVLPLPSCIVPAPRQLLTIPSWGPRIVHYVHTPRLSINQYLSVEVLTNIFLYAVEAYQMTPYQLVAVCRRWRHVINGMSHLWSILRLGTYTEIENIDIWLDRSRRGLLTIKIDPQRDIESHSSDQPYVGLQYALGSIDRWQSLVVASSPTPEAFVDFQTAKPLERLTSLEVGKRCQDSATLAHLLDHVSKTAILLSDMSLFGPCAITLFLQPSRSVVLSVVTTLIIHGEGIFEPVPILSLLGNLQAFEASNLPLPNYGLNTSLPFLSTLKQLKLRAVPIQWMAGREFNCLEGCTIIHALGQETIQLGINLPCCRTFEYQGYPISILQHFHTPQAKKMVLNTHDTRRKRVQQHLDICRLHGKLSQLHTLHLTLWCSEAALANAMEHMELLQELILSIAYPSSSWEYFLKSLAAEPPSKDWPGWYLESGHGEWKDWCASQTWCANLLPSLKSLCIWSPKGFSPSQCLKNCPILRYIAWTRAQMIPPLEHLKVWEGRGISDDIMVDYISIGYLDKHLGVSRKSYDRSIIRGIVTQQLVIKDGSTLLFAKLYFTVLFRQLQVLWLDGEGCGEINILPYLEQIKVLGIRIGTIPPYSLDIDLPLVHTLQNLILEGSPCTWMFGRVFKALERCECDWNSDKDFFWHNGQQVDMPACKELKWYENVAAPPFSCVNLQKFSWTNEDYDYKVDHRSLYDFLLNCPHLQYFDCSIACEHDSVIQFVLCDAREQGVWKDIRSVKMVIWGMDDVVQNWVQNHGREQHYDKWWKEFTVSSSYGCAKFMASM